MKLLVTGGAGYIGSVVAHQLVDAGHHVEIIDGLSAGFADDVPAATFHRISIHRSAEMLTPEAGFDGVLHLAASIEVAESVVGRRPGDPAICIASSDKARTRLGWKPEHPDLATIVGDAWRFHRAKLG